jgi:hypothetical protein
MAKVLFNDRWYEEVAPAGVYESFYEATVKTHAQQLWPRFHPVHFKASVYAGADGVKADMALIEKNYSEWWVVEIEMAQHSFESHVLPQTRKLAGASYGPDLATKLCDGCPRLDAAKVQVMVKEIHPRVLVVVNKPRPHWAKELKKIDALLAVFEMFKSDDDNEYMFRVNGEHPVGAAQLLSVCRFDDLMNRWLVVEDPIALRVSGQTHLTIEFEGHATEWVRKKMGSKVWLYTPHGPNPLPDRFDYELVRRGDGQLAFERRAKK